MADVKWIKIVTDIFDDDKILLIESMPEADAIIVIWFKMLCLAGKQNNSGVFLLNERIPYTDEMLATIFRRPLNTIRLALNTFEKFGMIEIVNDTITIPNWEKHQKLDALEASREATRKRVAKYRKKQKLLAEGGNVTDDSAECNVTDVVTVTSNNADRIDKNRVDKNRVDHLYYYKDDEDPYNPFGEGRRPDRNTVYAYASNELVSLSQRAMQEIGDYVNDLSEDVVRHAIDNALDQGVRTWAYVKTILNGYVDAEVHSVGDAKRVDEEYSKKRKGGTKQESTEQSTDKKWQDMTPEEQEYALNHGPFGPWVR